MREGAFGPLPFGAVRSRAKDHTVGPSRSADGTTVPASKDGHPVARVCVPIVSPHAAPALCHGPMMSLSGVRGRHHPSSLNCDLPLAKIAVY